MRFSLNGRKMTETVRAFNTWSEEFMVEAARPLIMLGFILGTVDLFTGFMQLASSSLFTVSWAIVQAVSIDGLFFAVLSQLAGAKGWQRRLSLAIVMIALAGVAFLVNEILTFQEVFGVSLPTAMHQLGLSALLFTRVRAGLVVVVSIASALVLERQHTFSQVVSQIVEEVHSIETLHTSRPSVPLIEESLVSSDSLSETPDETGETPHAVLPPDRETGETPDETPVSPVLRLRPDRETPDETGETSAEIEAYMRHHQCSRATAYRRMKKERTR